MDSICHGQPKVFPKLVIATSVLIILTTTLIVGTWWLLRGTRNEPEAMSHVQKVLQLTNVGDFAFEDETLLWRTNGSAVSAPARASEKNQAMDRLMAGRGMAPDDFSALMRRLHADGKQDELTRNFAVQHLGLYVQRRIRFGDYDPKSGTVLKLAARRALREFKLPASMSR